MLEVKNLTKKFKSGDQEVIAVNDLSFVIKEGQFVTITGKSGSGKSTLMYQLGLLDLPNSGTIHIDGAELVNMPEEDRTMVRLNDFGYIFQDYAILPSLTALENTLLPLLMQGYDMKEAEEKAKKALIKIGLGDKMGNLPSELSGGQQQRVSIARAISHDPKIIFADEPTANLDSETSASVIKAFLELNKEGQTIIMVTHEEEYAQMADRTIHLADGKIMSDKLNKK
ncbi:MAG: ABC transporter ATP-binding protein [Candidatus Pacebacteria bacterium]|nr:ABC transporter ATP-binding protein [Candidatus Paceibacterota bacterium]MBP9716095.1 ABC transporter ATP-binding protein [Candidatus Paceibacterota bacterium]